MFIVSKGPKTFYLISTFKFYTFVGENLLSAMVIGAKYGNVNIFCSTGSKYGQNTLVGHAWIWANRGIIAR